MRARGEGGWGEEQSNETAERSRVSWTRKRNLAVWKVDMPTRPFTREERNPQPKKATTGIRHKVFGLVMVVGICLAVAGAAATATADDAAATARLRS